MMQNDLQKKLTQLESLLATQKDCATNDYMFGLYNGMVLSHSVFSGTSDIKFLDKKIKTDKHVRHKLRNKKRK